MTKTMETMTRDEIAYTLEHANTALRTMVSLINRDWTTPHMREHLLAEIATLPRCPTGWMR
jgi:hypothetical protein